MGTWHHDPADLPAERTATALCSTPPDHALRGRLTRDADGTLRCIRAIHATSTTPVIADGVFDGSVATMTVLAARDALATAVRPDEKEHFDDNNMCCREICPCCGGDFKASTHGWRLRGRFKWAILCDACGGAEPASALVHAAPAARPPDMTDAAWVSSLAARVSLDDPVHVLRMAEGSIAERLASLHAWTLDLNRAGVADTAMTVELHTSVFPQTDAFVECGCTIAQALDLIDRLQWADVLPTVMFRLEEHYGIEPLEGSDVIDLLRARRAKALDSEDVATGR